MTKLPESNQRGSPDTAAPESDGTAGRSAKGVILVGALLTASLVMALGALSGTAAAETSSTDAGEAIASARQMASDMIEAAEGSTAVNVQSSARSGVKPGSSPIESHGDLDVSEMTRSFTAAASSSDPVKATVAEVAAAIHELGASTSPTVGTLGISEPETTSSTTIGSVEEEPIVMAEVTPASSHQINQCNPPAFPGATAGWEVTCEVEIVNTLTAEGDESAVVTTRTCLAAEGVLPPFGCTTNVQEFDELVTSVDQCNGVATGGGSNVTCDVSVINNVPVGTQTAPVTVNQCNGSGEGGVDPAGDPLNCSGPPDQDTTNADVNQCNGSANGGGAPGRVNCSVEGSVSAVPLDIDQCNGSANGGGSTVNCSVTVTNNFIEPGEEPDGEEPDGEEPDGETPDSETPDGEAPATGGPGTGGPATGGPAAGGPMNSGPENSAPVAVVPAALVTPVGPAAVASGSSLVGAGTSTEAASSASGTSTLPTTGSDIGSMMALALLAMMLGGLLILTSRSASKAAAKS